MANYAFRLMYLAVLISLTSACQASLAVHSQPEGAYLTEVGTGTPWGVAPVNLVYNLGQKDASGCYIIKGFDAKWVSGARVVQNTIKLCGSPFGSYTFTLNRPPEHPGLEKDLQFSLQVQSVRAQQSQAQSSSDAASALWYGAIVNSQ